MPGAGQDSPTVDTRLHHLLTALLEQCSQALAARARHPQDSTPSAPVEVRNRVEVYLARQISTSTIVHQILQTHLAWPTHAQNSVATYDHWSTCTADHLHAPALIPAALLVRFRPFAQGLQ